MQTRQNRTGPASPNGSAPTAPSPTAPSPTTPSPTARTGSPDRLPPVGAARRALGSLAVLATLPYLSIKVSWLTGRPVGLGDAALATSPAMLWLNGLTLGLDVAALALAVVLMTRRGLRAPAWLVVPPLWVGAGLLGQILLALPVSALLRSVASPSQLPTGQAPPIQQWVFTVVYTGFGVLGLSLLGAFALYARQRWGTAVPQVVSPGARVALRGAATLAVLAGGAHLVLSDVGLDSRLLDLSVALLGAGSLLALTRAQVRGAAATTATVLAFVTSGAAAAWGTYLGVITAVPNELVGQTSLDVPTVVASGLRLLAGLAGAAALRLRLAPGRRARAARGGRAG